MFLFIKTYINIYNMVTVTPDFPQTVTLVVRVTVLWTKQKTYSIMRIFAKYLYKIHVIVDKLELGQNRVKSGQNRFFSRFFLDVVLDKVWIVRVTVLVTIRRFLKKQGKITLIHRTVTFILRGLSQKKVADSPQEVPQKSIYYCFFFKKSIPWS